MAEITERQRVRDRGGERMKKINREGITEERVGIREVRNVGMKSGDFGTDLSPFALETLGLRD